MVRLNGFQGTNNLQLLIADGICAKLAWWFHRNQAQELHKVVLHHVPHRARFVIIGPAPADIDRLRHSDLDVIDVMVVPKWLEQNIAKADGHQVLHRLFAKVVVDPVNLFFFEVFGERRVQRFSGLQITTKGFFHNDTAIVVSNLIFLQPLRQIAEQSGPNREIEGADHVIAHQLGELFPAAIAPRVNWHVVQML